RILEEMGNAREAERCYDEALECFRLGLEAEPDNADLHYHRGMLLEDLERTDEAIDAFAAAASRTHAADALVRLSALLLRVGRPADALVPAEEARTRHPEDRRGWLAAGRAAFALDHAEEGEAHLRKAIDLGAGADASLELARGLQSIGRIEEALKVLEAVESPDVIACLLQADLHAALGRTEEALTDCDAAIRVATDGRDLAYRRKGDLLLRVGRVKQAAAAFDAALGLNPTDPEAWRDAARAWKAMGQEARARKMDDQARSLDPDRAELLGSEPEGSVAD